MKDPAVLLTLLGLFYYRVFLLAKQVKGGLLIGMPSLRFWLWC